jgi:hypothetical protein
MEKNLSLSRKNTETSKLYHREDSIKLLNGSTIQIVLPKV